MPPARKLPTPEAALTVKFQQVGLKEVELGGDVGDCMFMCFAALDLYPLENEYDDVGPELTEKERLQHLQRVAEHVRKCVADDVQPAHMPVWAVQAKYEDKELLIPFSADPERPEEVEKCRANVGICCTSVEDAQYWIQL